MNPEVVDLLAQALHKGMQPGTPAPAPVPEPPAIRNGVTLYAQDGTGYVVSNLQARHVLVRAKDCPDFEPARVSPDTPNSPGVQLLVERTHASLTLRRAIPKIRGKAAVKAYKRARHQAQERLRAQRPSVEE